MKLNRAFSLVEILVVLTLAVAFLCISSGIKTDITLKTPQIEVIDLLHETQQAAIKQHETVYLANDGPKFFIYDQYGRILSKKNIQTEAKFYDSDLNECSKITVFPSGFTLKYAVKFGKEKYFAIDPLSLNIHEIKR